MDVLWDAPEGQMQEIEKHRGGEVYENLKKINPRVKILLSSGYALDSNAKEILQKGCSGFIQKPFNLGEL